MTQLKNGNFQRNLLASAILAPVMILAGCSSSDSPSLDSSNSASGTASGFAYDGYLRHAKVCADVNMNKRCDADEPATTTGVGGKFELKDLTAAQALVPLAVEATAGVTIDEDTGSAVEKSFTYVAPAGSKAISAISTIIQTETERRISEGQSLASALKSAKTETARIMGLEGEDLTVFDPIAVAEENSSISGLAARLHLTNQVLTENIVVSSTEVAQAASGTTDRATRFHAAVGKVNEKTAAIKDAIDDAVLETGLSAPSLDASEVARIVNETVANAALKPEPASDQDIQDAAKAIEDAIAAIVANIKSVTGEEPTGATGGTGS